MALMGKISMEALLFICHLEDSGEKKLIRECMKHSKEF